MHGDTHALLDRFRTMDTRVLLARLRAGGLLPQAEATLLEVLAERGIVAVPAARKDAGEDHALRLAVRDDMGAVPHAGQGWSAFSWHRLMRKVTALLVQIATWAGSRGAWARIVRGGLLALCVLSVNLAGLVGLGGFVIANVFCDRGPLSRCLFSGSLVLGVGAAVVMVLVPAILALSSSTGRLAGYLKVLPLIPLPVLVAALHWHGIFPVLCTRAVELSGSIVLLASMQLILSRGSFPPPLPQPGGEASGSSRHVAERPSIARVGGGRPMNINGCVIRRHWRSRRRRPGRRP